jgi:hypothetical protein
MRCSIDLNTNGLCLLDGVENPADAVVVLPGKDEEMDVLRHYDLCPQVECIARSGSVNRLDQPATGAIPGQQLETVKASERQFVSMSRDVVSFPRLELYGMAIDHGRVGLSRADPEPSSVAASIVLHRTAESAGLPLGSDMPALRPDMPSDPLTCPRRARGLRRTHRILDRNRLCISSKTGTNRTTWLESEARQAALFMIKNRSRRCPLESWSHRS